MEALKILKKAGNTDLDINLEKNLVVSPSPHITGTSSTSKIMRDVIIALSPAAAAGIYYFGYRAALVIAVTVAACILSEYISCKVLKKANTVSDLSAVVTGILLALNLTPSIPLWIAAVGGVVAIVIVKQVFGGIGQNFMNPALAARVIMIVSWPEAMTRWIDPGTDAVSAATPLAIIKKGAEITEAARPVYFDLFIGNIAGCIGETSVAALLAGGIYLLIRKVISYEIPLTYIGTVALMTWVLGGGTLFSGDFIYHILGGGLFIGAFFMATDYTTSPITYKGRLIMGVGCGLLTSLIRLYTGYPEGVSFSILIMNITVPLIDRYTIPVPFGGSKRSA